MREPSALKSCVEKQAPRPRVYRRTPGSSQFGSTFLKSLKKSTSFKKTMIHGSGSSIIGSQVLSILSSCDLDAPRNLQMDSLRPLCHAGFHSIYRLHIEKRARAHEGA